MDVFTIIWKNILLTKKGRCRFSLPIKFWSWSLETLAYQLIKALHQIWYSGLYMVKLLDLANLGILQYLNEKENIMLIVQCSFFSSNYASVMKDSIVRKWMHVSSSSLCHRLRTVSFLERELLLLLVQKYALNSCIWQGVAMFWIIEIECTYIITYCSRTFLYFS